MAIANGLRPALIGFPGVLVAVVIGVTVFEWKLVTYAVLPLGVTARPWSRHWRPVTSGSPPLRRVYLAGR